MHKLIESIPMDNDVCPRCGGDEEIQVPNGQSGPRGDAFDFVPCPECQPRVIQVQSVFYDGIGWVVGDKVSAEVEGDLWHGEITDLYAPTNAEPFAAVQLGNGVCAHIWYTDFPLSGLQKAQQVKSA